MSKNAEKDYSASEYEIAGKLPSGIPCIQPVYISSCSALKVNSIGKKNFFFLSFFFSLMALVMLTLLTFPRKTEFSKQRLFFGL